MGDFPLPAIPTGVLSYQTTDDGSADLWDASEPASFPAVLEFLRQAVAEGSRPTDSILAAIADSARIVSEADGIAIASRLKGPIVCRARSGDIAPALGAPLSSESGISGACLRTGKTLICNDTLTDQRVDAEVCEQLGIRSIAVVPLREGTGVFGILEAFSSRQAAFRSEQVESLRSLADIAEMAYATASAVPTQTAAPAPATIRYTMPVALPAAGDRKRQVVLPFDRKATLAVLKRYWVFGALALAILLIFAVVRLSWRQTGSEIASRESRAQPSQPATVSVSNAPAGVAPAKPNGGIEARQVRTSESKGPLKNAADIQPATESSKSAPSLPTLVPPSTAPSAARQPSSAPDDDSPPSVELATTNVPDQLAHLPVGSQPMPEFAAPVSKGVVAPVLVKKVTPMYPTQARVQRLSGSVILDATVAPNGSVNKVAVVSGPPILAAAASAAVREWRYKPAMLDGKQVETQQRITVVFNLP
jgi:TonB family protein